MSNPIHYYTQEGFDKAKAHLQNLKINERRQISSEIEEARSKGDLSENAEYHAAKEAQELLEKKIAELELKLGNVRIINPEKIDKSKVAILSTVQIKNLSNNTTLTYTIVPSEEADFKNKKISITSPIGKGLLGKKVGDTAQINIPIGTIDFEILSIE